VPELNIQYKVKITNCFYRVSSTKNLLLPSLVALARFGIQEYLFFAKNLKGLKNGSGSLTLTIPVLRWICFRFLNNFLF
jgi:hypothetical protein